MYRPDRSYRSPRGLVKLRDLPAARRNQDPESGQAMVEFALILLPLLILVVGIIQFGIGINYWLDMNRLSNQGARWAVVNSYPGCTETSPNNTQVSCGTTTSLQRYIACQRLPNALKPTVDISFPSGASTFGNPVKVELRSPYSFRAIMKLGTITLTARTTMRIERSATRYAAGPFTPTTCP